MSKTNTKVVLGVTAAAGLIAGLVVSTLEGEALADRSDTVLSATVDWEAVTIRKYIGIQPDGGTTSTMDVTVCGTALLSNGEVSPADHRCDSVDLTAPQQTTVNSVVAAALARWKAKRGL